MGAPVRDPVAFRLSRPPPSPPALPLPPKVVRPHLAPPLLGALCSHPMLKLDNWDPWRPLEDVVGAVKAFVEAHGRVVRFRLGCALGGGGLEGSAAAS